MICQACSLDVKYENKFSDPEAISTPSRARELLASAYYSLPDASFELSVLSDDFEPTGHLQKDVGLNNLYHWKPLQIEELATSLWQGWYSCIAIANAVLERTGMMKNLEPKEEKKRISVVAEANVLKAYCYFNLMRLFSSDYADGPDNESVPFKRELKFESLPRLSIKACADSVRTLLGTAMKNDWQVSSEFHFSKESANYLNAELELFCRNYKEAARYAEGLISNYDITGLFGIETYKSLWSDAACAERIFSWFTPNSYYMGIYLTRDLGDILTVSKSLREMFAPGDIRYDATVFPYKPESGDIMYCFGKYNRENKEKRIFTTVSRFRASGLYFILAEAYCLDGRPDEAAAVMNRYLSGRKAATAVPQGTSGDGLLKIILEEKRKEFVGEGERFFDLKRYRKTILSDWNKTGAASGKKIKEDDYRWIMPVPKGEYLYNNNMSQNPGWQKIEQ